MRVSFPDPREDLDRLLVRPPAVWRKIRGAELPRRAVGRAQPLQALLPRLAVEARQRRWPAEEPLGPGRMPTLPDAVSRDVQKGVGEETIPSCESTPPDVVCYGQTTMQLEVGDRCVCERGK